MHSRCPAFSDVVTFDPRPTVCEFYAAQLLRLLLHIPAGTYVRATAQLSLHLLSIRP